MVRLFSLTTGVWALTAEASDSALSPVKIGVSPSLTQFKYQETGDNGEALNTERGLIPGLRLSLNTAYQRHKFQLAYQYSAATVDYAGQTQAGAPHDTDTEETFNQLELQWRYQLDPNQQSAIGVRAAFWQWDRDIQARSNVSGLSEIYQWYELGLRASQVIRFSDNLHSELSLDLFRVLAPTLEVDLTDFGGSVEELQLGEKPGLMIEWRFSLFENRYLQASMTPYYRRHKLGRSDNKAISIGANNGSIHEPNSATQMLGVSWTLLF